MLFLVVAVVAVAAVALAAAVATSPVVMTKTILKAPASRRIFGPLQGPKAGYF